VERHPIDFGAPVRDRIQRTYIVEDGVVSTAKSPPATALASSRRSISRPAAPASISASIRSIISRPARMSRSAPERPATDGSRAISSALTKVAAVAGRYLLAKLVFPAPFGPAMRVRVGMGERPPAAIGP
jgi:hypothetical protein